MTPVRGGGVERPTARGWSSAEPRSARGKRTEQTINATTISRCAPRGGNARGRNQLHKRDRGVRYAVNDNTQLQSTPNTNTTPNGLSQRNSRRCSSLSPRECVQRDAGRMSPRVFCQGHRVRKAAAVLSRSECPHRQAHGTAAIQSRWNSAQADAMAPQPCGIVAGHHQQDAAAVRQVGRSAVVR